ncbi:hypothetical protein FBALC1_05858 [Flavobacteriales bacterium ALC-1]|nr:hypothetical protein FBALC1_05858 [Flavobacteriales bacterium ALC-1]
MKKFKLKIFVIIFFILLVIQFLIGLADVLLSQADSELTSFTSILITVCSFPINMINRDLPFYTNEGTGAAIIFWIMNLIIQATIVYGFKRIYKRVKRTY